MNLNLNYQGYEKYLFLEELYSDSSQDSLLVQSEIKELPLNKEALKVYENVYTEFDGFFKTLDNYSIKY